jgi:integrase
MFMSIFLISAVRCDILTMELRWNYGEPAMQKRITETTAKTAQPQSKPYEIFDTKVPGFLLRIQPTGSKAYYVQYRRPGGRRARYRLGSTEVVSTATARDEAKDFLAAVQLGDDPAEAKRLAKAETLESFLKQVYGPWVIEHRRSGTATYNRLLSAFKPMLSMSLHEITPFAIAQWRTKRKKAKPTLKNATLNGDCACLKSALSWAVKHGYLATHPLTGLERLAQHDSEAIVRYLTPDEEKRLLKALDDREEEMRKRRDSFNKWRAKRGRSTFPDLRKLPFADHIKPMVLISLNTGVRRGELFGLEWRDIDFDHGVITVRKEVAKSGKTRHIPMNSTVRTTLTKWRKQTTSASLVFRGETGGRFDNANKGWRTVLKKAGLTDSFRWHDMRHDFASKLVMRGVDLYVVKELLGHASIVMTEKYAHLAPVQKRAAVEMLEVPLPKAGNVVAFPG